MQIGPHPISLLFPLYIIHLLLYFYFIYFPNQSLIFLQSLLLIPHFIPFRRRPDMMHHCGGGGGGASSFSVFLSVPNNHGAGHEMMDNMYSTNYASSSSPSSVDCTLSLGTPSTRSSELDGDKRAPARHHRRSAGSYVSNFCWDLLHPKHKSSTPRPGANNTAAVPSGGDPLLARRCANCDTTSTPLWRNGPRGPKSLCNACGIRFKKEERRAAATVNSTAAGVAAESNHHHHHHHHHPMFGGNYTNSTTWVPQHSPATTQKLPCLSPAPMNNESMFIGNDDVRRTEPENCISFLSWRLNVANTDHRPSLVHDFTR